MDIGVDVLYCRHILMLFTGRNKIMFYNILFNVFCIFLMMVPGFVAVKQGYFSRTTIAETSTLMVRFIYPCFIFHAIIDSFSFRELVSSWTLPAICLGLMFFGYFVGIAVIRLMKFNSEDEKTGFIFQCTLNNYSFLPLPLVMFMYGIKGAAALIFSSFGAEIAVWTLGVFILEGRKLHLKNLKHLLSPPLVSLYLAIIVLFIFDLMQIDTKIFFYSESFGLTYFFKTIGTIGLATIPLAIIIAGGRIAEVPHSGLRNYRVWILSFLRLIAIPATAIVIIKLLPLPEMTEKIMLVVAVMPVSIASILFSEIYKIENSFITVTVFVTHILSLITVPVMLTLAMKF